MLTAFLYIYQLFLNINRYLVKVFALLLFRGGGCLVSPRWVGYARTRTLIASWAKYLTSMSVSVASFSSTGFTSV